MIDARRLTRRFGTFTAVSHISFHVPDGSILALLGPNGAGKTTTVRMLSGLLAPSEGEATIADYDVCREPDAVRACVGLVTDAPGLFEQMKVPAYLDFFAGMYEMSPAERSRRIDELMEFFDLSAHRQEKMIGFSKGMKQKVALARALIHEPQVLFLDEPTSGLDPLAARAVRDLITRLKHSRRSIILCTHDLDEAERLADQIAILRHGRLVTCDTPATLRRQATGETKVQMELVVGLSSALERLHMISGIQTPRFIQSGTPVEPAQTSMNGNAGAMGQDVPVILEYYTAQPKSVNPQVVSQLVEVGAQIVSVTCETRTLEDVYASAMRTGSAESRDTGAL